MIAEGRAGHIEKIKQTNSGTVYRLIDQLGPISRIELSKHAQLAPASITKIVRELLEAHLIKETEYQELNGRGRPAIGLMLDNETWHYLSMRVGLGTITLALHDIGSKIVVEELLPLTPEHSQPLLQRIVSEVDNFFIRHQAKLQRLTAIAITLPGMISNSTGVVYRMPFYEVNDMALGPALKKLTGLPVYLQHDTCAWTMAEALNGASRGNLNVIQVVIDHNVGAGIISNGKILYAGNISVGEIGHIQVDPNGKRCYCGNHGCLETVTSIGNILENTQQQLKDYPSSMLHDVALGVESLCDAALAGDLLAQNIILGVGQRVGAIVAIMVNLFNPEKILIGSPLNRAAEILHPAIIACIRQQSIPACSENIKIESTQFFNQGSILGATLVKNALYDGSLLLQLLQG